MPLTYFGPYGEQYSDYAFQTHANLGRWPLGHTLILPDQREYRFTLNDGTVEIAGDLYQGVAAVANHTNVAANEARSIGAIVISATLGATAAAVDIYTEGIVHINDALGEGYSHRIKRAMSVGDAHASAATSSVLTVNLAAGESVRVALDTTSEMTFTRNRYHAATIHLSPPTARLTGVSPGVAAANRFYWSQVKGPAAVLANLTLLAGLPAQASVDVNGAVEMVKRRIGTGGTTALLSTSAMAVLYMLDQDGTTTGYGIIATTTGTTVSKDVTSGIADNAPYVGMCVKANASTEFALIDLDIK